VGREALVHAEVGDETGEVRALLESAEMILRGAIRRRFPKSSIKSVTVKSDTLCFTCAGELVRLHLGPRAAEAWRKAIAVPPPGLRAKLGLDKGARALLVGSFDDDVLANALKGVIVKDGLDAAMLIVCVRGAGDLAAARPSMSSIRASPFGRSIPKGEEPPSVNERFAPRCAPQASTTPSRAPSPACSPRHVTISSREALASRRELGEFEGLVASPPRQASGLLRGRQL